jgi:hypothetical protein
MKVKIFLILVTLILITSCRDNDLAQWYQKAQAGDTLALQQRFYLDYCTSCLPDGWTAERMWTLVENAANDLSEILYNNRKIQACLDLPYFPPDFVQVGNEYNTQPECSDCRNPESAFDLRYSVANVEDKAMDLPPLRRRIVWMNCAINDTFQGDIAFSSKLKTRWKEQMSDVIVLCREASETLMVKDPITELPVLMPAFNDCQWTVILMHELMHSILWVDESEANCHDIATQGFIPAGSDAEGGFPYIIRRLGPFSELSAADRKNRWFVKIFGLDYPNAAHCIEDTVLFMACEEYLDGLIQGDYAGSINLPIANRDRKNAWNEKKGKYIPRKCWEDWACEEIKKAR